MSIYSGFSLRKMQERYNKFLEKLIFMFQSDMIEFMSPCIKGFVQNQDIGEYLGRKFYNYLMILGKLQTMEQHKYLQPKFSRICIPLKRFISQIIPSNTSLQKSFVSNPLLTSRKSIKSTSILNRKQYSKYQRLKTKKVSYQSKSLDSSCRNTHKKIDLNQIKESPYQKAFPIYTIQEVQQNISTKQFKKINIQQLSYGQKNNDKPKKAKNYKIYKSLDKLRQTLNEHKNSDEPDFPSYQKQSFSKQEEQKIRQNPSQQMKTQQNSIKNNSFYTQQSLVSDNKKIFYQTDFNFRKTELQEFKKINFPVKKKLKSSTDTPNSQSYIKVHKKKFIDRSDLKKLITQLK